MNLQDRYTFFRQHAGGIVGRNALGAIELARAEAALEDAVADGLAAVRWEYEDAWSYGDLGDAFDQDEMSDRFASNEWTGPFVCALDIGGDRYAASLGMIVLGPRGTADPYARVVVAELASELVDTLRLVRAVTFADLLEVS